MAYQGPVKPGTSEKVFRDTGKSTPSFQGPVRPGDDESTFRETGRSSGGSSRRSGGGSSSSNSVQAAQVVQSNQAQAIEQQKQAEQQKQQEAQKQAEAQKAAELEKARATFYAAEQQKAQVLAYNRATTGTIITEQDKTKYNVDTTPYYETRVTGSYIDKETGKTVPVTTTYYVNPTGKDEGKGATSSTERVASEAEYAEVKPAKELVASEEKISKITQIKDETVANIGTTYNRANRYLREATTDPIANMIVEQTKGTTIGGYGGLTLEKFEQNIKDTDIFLKSKIKNEGGTTLFDKDFVLSGLTDVGKFTAGQGAGIIEDYRNKPLKQVLTYGAGKAVGAAVKGVEFAVTSAGIKYSDKVVDAILAGKNVNFATRVGANLPKIFETSVNVGGLAAGTIYAANTIEKVTNAPNAFEAGKLTGVELNNLLLFGLGTQSGTRSAEKLYDLKIAKTRTELPIEDVGLQPITEVLSGQKRFVESSQFGGSNKAGLGKQKFDINIFDKAGRTYTVSPTKFAGKKFIAAEGSSEFKGLYGAPSPSVYFGKAGNQYGNVFGLYKAGGSPNVILVEGMKGKFNIKGLKTGEGFVTGVKPEIEAVYKAGTAFERTGQEVFFKYKGRNFPVDTFKVIEVPTVNLPLPKVGPAGYSSSSSTNLGGISLVSPLSGFTPSTASSSTSNKSYKVSAPLPNLDVSSYTAPSTTSYVKPSYISGGSSGRSSRVSSVSPSSIISSISGSPSRPSPSKPSPSYPSSYRPSRTSYSPYGQSVSSISKTYKPSSTVGGYKLPKSSSIKLPKGGYGVEVRRGGKFYNVGTTKTLNQAIGLGSSKVSKTLAATYRIKGAKGLPLPTQKGFYSKTSKKEGLVFVEKRKYRLSKLGEKLEIQSAKRRKKR